jgi:hypothetical protein
VTCPDDGNVCTTASCDPITGCGQVNNTANCDDANFCTVNDSCSNGLCGGSPNPCNDNNPCTNDRCDGASQTCVHTPAVCDDGKACTDDSCNPATGCVFTNDNTNTCSDNSLCTSSDQCSNGNCLGTPVTCPDDGNVCTTASCDPITGCGQANNTASCDDANFCTVNDSCSNGLCGGSPNPCNDNNPCTNDSCDGASQTCVHTPAVCDDGKACTDDSCNPATGCVFTNDNTNTCSDNSLCTSSDQCSNGNCLGTPVTCPDDGNVCTTASCDPITGCGQVNNTANCDDANRCTENDRCMSGACAGSPKNCDDQNPNTSDRCNPATGACEHI